MEQTRMEQTSLIPVVDIVRRVPGWHDADPVITPLPGGITNRNYRVELDGAAFVVRLPGERTELLGIDRAGEAAASYLAADLGIAPAVRAELQGVGTLVTEFVGGVPATTEALLEPGVLETITAMVRRFHGSGPIAASFPIFRVVEWHARDAAANGVEPPAVYDELHEAASAIEAVFDPRSLESTMCHNDLLPANVLLTPERLWIIDYEYAGMNHAVFDLANLSVNCGFDDAADHRLLMAYDGDVSDRRLAQLALMKMMSEMREGMWAVVQQAISNLTTIDFGEYAASRLEHCRELCADQRFPTWLEQARDA
jgi:thiamine kinase-like enzyme